MVLVDVPDDDQGGIGGVQVSVQVVLDLGGAPAGLLLDLFPSGGDVAVGTREQMAVADVPLMPAALEPVLFQSFPAVLGQGAGTAGLRAEGLEFGP